MKDVFPGERHSGGMVEFDPWHVDGLDTQLQRALREGCDREGYATAHTVPKASQLHEALLSRTGAVLVGPTGGGKSTVWRVLAAAIDALCEEIYPKVCSTPLAPF